MNLPINADDARTIRVTAKAAKVDIVWTLGPNGARPVAGGPNWDEEARANRRSLLVYGGSAAYRMSVDILLDSWLARGARTALVQRQYAALQTLWTPATVTTSPPVCTLSGAALPRQGGNWVILSVDESNDELMRSVDDGRILRYRATVTFGQIVNRDVLEIKGLVGGAAATQLYRWQAGDTLQRVAAKRLKNSSRWQQITWPDGSKIRPGDPKLKPGARVRVPTS